MLVHLRASSTHILLSNMTNMCQKRCRNCWGILSLTLEPFAASFSFWVDLEEPSLCCLFTAHWTAKGQTRCMLSEGGGSCHSRPGCYQDGISRLCLDDRTACVSITAVSTGVFRPRCHDSQLSMTIGQLKGTSRLLSAVKTKSWAPAINICPKSELLKLRLDADINLLKQCWNAYTNIQHLLSKLDFWQRFRKWPLKSFAICRLVCRSSNSPEGLLNIGLRSKTPKTPIC